MIRENGDPAVEAISIATSVPTHARLARRATRRVTGVGSEKMAVFDDMQPDEKVKSFDKGVENPQPADTGAAGNGGAWRPPVSYGEYVQLRLGDTYGPRISPEAEGIAAVEIPESLQRSLDRGGEVVPVAAAPLRA